MDARVAAEHRARKTKRIARPREAREWGFYGWAACLERGFLNAQTVELGAQAVCIHPGGLADSREVPLVLEKIFFSLAFGAKRT